MNQLIVNEKHHFSIEQKEGKIFLEGNEFIVDLQEVNAHTFHILYENKSYTAELVALDKVEKKATVKINGHEYEIALKDEYDALLASMGMQFSKKSGLDVLKAPMPGLVLDVRVKVGDTVKKGDNLLVLEAMKMENIIKSADDVIIKSIEIGQGSIVEKNQVLLTFE